MKENKIKGFTLIELLAVIVILAIIALIATPIILNVIEESRDKSNMNSTYGLVDAAKLYYAENITDGKVSFDTNLLDTLKVTGKKPDSGYVMINDKGEIVVGASYGKYCYTKGYTESKIVKNDDNTVCDTPPGPKPATEVVKNANNIIETNNYLGDKDYRYNGPDVNNYVTFSDEPWRIIGLVNGRVKIIRNESIGDKPWGSSSGNNWNEASLKIYLNGEYYQNLKDKNMVEETTYNLGGIDSTDKTVDEIYAMENGTDVYSDHPEVSDSIHIALMYPSDYGYSMKTGDGFCESTPGYYFSGDECKANGTWLYNGGRTEWLLTPYSGDGFNASNVYSSGYLNYSNNVNYSRSVRPSLYLKSSVKIAGGEGTEDNPYTLSEE